MKKIGLRLCIIKEKVKDRIHKYIQMRRILNKVQERLPNYHPRSGEILRWNVSFKYKNDGYSKKDGKPINNRIVGISIRQKCCPGNHAVYACDRWGRLRITRARWQ